MKLSALFVSGLTTAVTVSAQAASAAPYTDAKSGITFNAFQHASGYFFGIALPESTNDTDFIATIGGKGTGWSGVSLAGPMKNSLLVVTWPNGQTILSSFRKTPQYGSPAVASGTFTQFPITNGTYINSTHWTYTFLCSKCIQADSTTFLPTDEKHNFGYALNAAAPPQKTNASSPMSKHSQQGQASFDLSKARSKDFATWKTWAAPKVVKAF